MDSLKNGFKDKVPIKAGNLSLRMDIKDKVSVKA